VVLGVSVTHYVYTRCDFISPDGTRNISRHKHHALTLVLLIPYLVDVAMTENTFPSILGFLESLSYFSYDTICKSI